MEFQVDETYDCRGIQKAAWFTPLRGGRWGLNINWIGPVGGGKSSTITELSRQCGLESIVVLLGQREPSDLLGIPIPSADGFMSYCAPDFARRANNAAGAVIYLDEANYATPAVQGAAQRMILEGHVGDVMLEPTVRFALSMNPVDQAAGAGGQDLSMAFANRAGHIPWINPTVAGWTDWMMSDENAVPPMGNCIAIQNKTLAAWPMQWATARAKVTTFLRSHPSLLSLVPSANSPDASGAFPTPRSWENATRALASSMVHKLDEESARVFMAAFVGHAAINEFLTWAERNDLPDPEDLFSGKMTFTHDPRRLDVTMAVVAAITMVVLDMDPSDEKFSDRVDVMWDILLSIADRAPDIVLSSVVSISRSTKARMFTAKSPKATSVLAAVRPLQSLLA